MTDVVTDIDRPDVNGVPPLMTDLCKQVRDRIGHLESHSNVSCSITCSDNFLSNISIYGSFDLRETWNNGIYLNSRHFRFGIVTENGKRYYADGDRVTVELERVSHKIPAQLRKFRKYTGTTDKVIAKVEAWILAVMAEEVG